ncbi:hypothetical protein PsYK624_043900 [Phanerochaete sordida]|uniref:Uncharacterized protein n=1 Tax=Phanerochaete sordida TaxID=48140 RepID=A0A9P3G566_9APHY|nr:hypothetical protein PsYK624_043900 [Phanerochaete sordida]
MQAVSSVRHETKREPEDIPLSPSPADSGSRSRDGSSSANMPPRISGHDLMAIFPTNPPSHNVSCDDLFKKQARQFLSTPESPLRPPREPANGAPGPYAARGEAVANGHDAQRAALDPNLQLHPQQHAASPQPNGRAHARNGSASSRPHTGSRPSTGQQGSMPVIYQYEPKQSEPGSQRSSERRTKSSESPLPLFTRQPLSLDRSRTNSQA